MSAHWRHLGAAFAWALAAASLMLSSSAQPAHAEGHPVTRVTVGVRPVAYTGKCPAHLRFIGTIVVSQQPIVVEYQWERSDGAKSSPQRIEVRGKGRGVVDTWDLGAPHERQQVWEKLHILSPNTMTSASAIAHVTCH
jgi:hypothetical protein